MRSKLFKTTLSSVFAMLVALPAWAAELKVAAAVSAKDALDEITGQFEKKTGNHVSVTYGSSGKLFTQVSQGAPFDLYFSADTESPAELFKQGLCEPPKRYGRGRLVLWTLKPSPLDIDKGLKTLLDPRIQKVAIANPVVAPYGRAAVETMRFAKVYEQVEKKLVKGENISQTAQFVDSGAADIGFLSLSLAYSPKLKERGKYWMVPLNLHQPIDQDAAVLKGSQELATARQFLSFCTSGETREVWHRFGLE